MKLFKFPKLGGAHLFAITLLMVLGLISLITPHQLSSDDVVTASLVGTLMQPLRSKETDSFDKNELRESRYGALRFFQEESAMRPIFDPETLANITRSYGNSVVVPVMDAQAVSVSTPYTRTCAIADSENDSALVTLTFASYGWKFSMTPATHFNNEVSYQRDFDRKMKKYLLAYADALDVLCINQLETDKNAFFPAALTDYYAVVANALQVPQANKDDFYNNVEAIMATMDFYDTAHIVSSTKHMPMIREASAQGQSNDKDQQWQFSGTGSEPTGKRIRPFNFWPTNRLANGAGVESSAFIVNAGSVFLGNRNDADSILGGNIGDHKVWSQEQLPIVNQLMGNYYQQDCGDRSAIAGAATAGNTRSRVEGFEFSTDVITASAYNSDTVNRYQPILKAEILS